jgi:hypothetical protein
LDLSLENLFSVDFLICRRNFEISRGIFRVPLEIFFSSKSSKFPAGFLDFQRDRFCASGEVGVWEKRRIGDLHRSDSLERRSQLIDDDRFDRAPVGVTEHADSLHLKTRTS